MKNKGFTLLELLGVVLLLAAIFMLCLPAFQNTLLYDKDTEYNNMVNTLCEAGKSYIYSNMGEYNDQLVANNKIEIMVNILISNNYVGNDIINPKTKKNVKLDKLYYNVKYDKSLECEYVAN